MSAELREKVAASKATPAVVGPRTIDQLLRDPVQQAEIAKALPSTFTPERFARIALTAIKGNPELMACTAKSLIGAAMISAQLGLELGGPLQQTYLIPFRVNGILEAQWILGYRGVLALARRSGEISSIEAREVYEADEFVCSYGTNGELRHIPALISDRGRVVAYYCFAKFVNGGEFYLTLTPEDVEQHRNFSKAPNSPAWKNHFNAMARKTAVRVAAPYLPLTSEAAKALAQDETVQDEIGESMIDNAVDFVDTTATEVADEPTPPG